MLIRSLFLFLILCCFNIIQAQTNSRNKFELNGIIQGKNDGMIYLVHRDNYNQRFVDSSSITNGRFYFSGEINGVSDNYFLKSDPAILSNYDSLNTLRLELENAKMEIMLEWNHFSSYKLKGCATCDAVSNKKFLYPKNSKKGWKRQIAYIKSNPDNNLSSSLLFWLHQSASDFDYKTYIGAYESLSDYQKQSYFGIKAGEKVELFTKLLEGIGKPAPNFSFTDIDGQKAALYSLTNKSVVLLNFWASWCVPCRAETPVLQLLTKKYQKEGFTIFGISADDNIDLWREAVAVDKVTNWVNALDSETTIKRNKNRSGEDMDEFQVQNYPTLILLDKGGIIIGRYNLVELKTKLSALYGY